MENIFCIEIPIGMKEQIQLHYRTPQRYYHTLQHIMEFMQLYQQLAEDNRWEHPKEIYLAILYHDAVYNYGAKDNELQSALLAKKEIKSFLPDWQVDVEYMSRLIELTAKHSQLSSTDISVEEALFLDCDMAILASSMERFREYEEQISQEYTQVYNRFLYKIGRTKFLRGVLQSPRIYLSDYFFQRYEHIARENIASIL